MVEEAKLREFEKVIYSDANKKADEIIAEAKKSANGILSKAKIDAKQYKEEVLNSGAKSADKKSSVLVSAAAFNLKKELLIERTKLVSGMFDKIASRLLEFTNTDEYREYLVNAVNSAKISKGEKIILEVSDRDKELAKKLFSEYEVNAVNNIKIGGVRIIKAGLGVMIDKTFDEAIKEEMSKFIATSGLTIC